MIELLRLTGAIADTSEREMQPGRHGYGWAVLPLIVAAVGVAAIVVGAGQIISAIGSVNQ